jgi:hypothetical protein
VSRGQRNGFLRPVVPPPFFVLSSSSPIIFAKVQNSQTRSQYGDRISLLSFFSIREIIQGDVLLLQRLSPVEVFQELEGNEEPCYGKKCTANEHCCPGSVCVDVDGSEYECEKSLNTREYHCGCARSFSINMLWLVDPLLVSFQTIYFHQSVLSML